jgi:hypothetical protein
VSALDSELSELQTLLAGLLMRRRALDKDPEIVARSPAWVTGNDRLLPVDQLEIYREQFWLRHSASLVEDFPGLGGILGQADWERLVEEYLVAHPPESFSLRDLGDKLPAFVETCDWLPHRELCTDMARLEWAYVDAFDAAEAGALDAAKLAGMPEDAWETAQIVLAPAVRLLETRYPVAELRRALRTSTDPVPIPGPHAEHLVIHRTQGSLFFHPAPRGAFEILRALADGLPLGAACERAVERVPAEAESIENDVATWFEDWGKRGFIVDVLPSPR